LLSAAVILSNAPQAQSRRILCFCCLTYGFREKRKIPSTPPHSLRSLGSARDDSCKKSHSLSGAPVGAESKDSVFPDVQAQNLLRVYSVTWAAAEHIPLNFFLATFSIPPP
jgi:hypothetical protein